MERGVRPALWVLVLHPQAGKFTQGCGPTCVMLGLGRVTLVYKGTWGHRKAVPMVKLADERIPWWSSGLCIQYRKHRFDPWSGN